MTLSELIQAVALRMKDASFVLMSQEDYQDQVEAAILEYSRFRPRHHKASLTLVAAQSNYTAPTDFDAFLMSEWGEKPPHKKPWDRASSLSGAPEVFFVDGQLHFNPVPTATQIAAFGATFDYLYKAAHVVDESASTIPDRDNILVRLAALSSACKEIASDPNQSDAFVKRYYSLAKRYGERFTELIGNPKAAMVRS